MKSRGRIFRAASILSCYLICVGPAWAKHLKEVPNNIFTPPPADTSLPSFGIKKTASVPNSILDGKDEPHWDIIKSLPDLLPEQNKALNKLQQETQKFNNTTRTQMNEAQQALKELKARRDGAAKSKVDMKPAIALLNPDGKPYTGPLLEAPEMGTDQSQESINDLQTQIDGLKEKIKDSNMKASGLARAILSQDQINELVLMRDGKLTVATPTTIFVDSPSESTRKPKNKRELANNAGSRVLRQILSGPNKGLRNAQEI
jgi:hypothetical protein